MRTDISEVMSSKQVMQKELEKATQYITAVEEKVYKSNKISLELLRQLKEAEVEIETLQQCVTSLKQRVQVYTPVKGDAIDKKLAEFINSYPEFQNLRVIFGRSQEGVYTFGSRRVHLTLENEKLKVRVGGGYLSMDQFLEQYTAAEVEKLERNDPLCKLRDKLQILSSQKAFHQSGSPSKGAKTNRITASESPLRESKEG